MKQTGAILIDSPVPPSSAIGLSSLAQCSVRIDDKFLCRSFVKVLVALRRIVQPNSSVLKNQQGPDKT